MIAFLFFYWAFSIAFMLGYVYHSVEQNDKLLTRIFLIGFSCLLAPALMPINIGEYLNKDKR